jgi:hypothetical protein
MLKDEPRKKKLAETLAKVLEKLNTELGDPGYSMLIQNAPITPGGYDNLSLLSKTGQCCDVGC